MKRGIKNAFLLNKRVILGNFSRETTVLVNEMIGKMSDIDQRYGIEAGCKIKFF